MMEPREPSSGAACEPGVIFSGFRAGPKRPTPRDRPKETDKDELILYKSNSAYDPAAGFGLPQRLPIGGESFQDYSRYDRTVPGNEFWIRRTQ
jgi:hypothetical protein